MNNPTQDDITAIYYSMDGSGIAYDKKIEIINRIKKLIKNEKLKTIEEKIVLISSLKTYNSESDVNWEINEELKVLKFQKSILEKL